MEPQDQAANVFAADGLVVVDGPEGLTATFTPQAAIETAERLLSAAAEARSSATD